MLFSHLQTTLSKHFSSAPTVTLFNYKHIASTLQLNFILGNILTVTKSTDLLNDANGVLV